VATVPAKPEDKIQLLASQIEACESAKLEYSLTSITRCDDSGDCAKDQVCCAEFMYSGAVAVECVPRSKLRRGVCELGEACRPDVPCRTPGARCVDGGCVKPVDSLRCGASVCSGGQVCCGDPPACLEPGATCDLPHYRCAGPKDCLPGEYCMKSVTGSGCRGMLDMGTAALACDVDAECPPSVCLGAKGKRPHCAAAPGSWIKTCDC
jgi:hypothetical protein